MPYSLTPSSDGVVKLLSELVHQRTGIFFETDQQDRLLDKISPLAAERGMESLIDYYYLLKYGEEADAEWRRVACALAVNETYFWREVDQIQAAAKTLVPHLQAVHPQKPVRIWHAACASGEEPFSMAIALEEAGCYLTGPIEIIATDFNEDALAQALRASFRPHSFRALPLALKEKYFTPEDGDRLHLRRDIYDRVSFFTLNLVDSPAMSLMRDFDIIFCRNSFIYFSTAAIRKVTNLFHQSLRDPGYLFIAAAESLLKITISFELIEIDGAFAYKKVEN